MSSGSKHDGWRVAAAVVLLAAGVGCGDEGNAVVAPIPAAQAVLPGVSPTPSASGTTLLEGVETVFARQLYFVDVIVDRPGTLEIAADYELATSDMLFWLTDRRCSRPMFDDDRCDYLAKSLEGPKPRTLSVAGVEPGTYTLFVHNNNQERDEKLTYRIRLR